LIGYDLVLQVSAGIYNGVRGILDESEFLPKHKIPLLSGTRLEPGDMQRVTSACDRPCSPATRETITL
jgi:hypothetical protein